MKNDSQQVKEKTDIPEIKERFTKENKELLIIIINETIKEKEEEQKKKEEEEAKKFRPFTGVGYAVDSQHVLAQGLII